MLFFRVSYRRLYACPFLYLLYLILSSKRFLEKILENIQIFCKFVGYISVKK